MAMVSEPNTERRNIQIVRIYADAGKSGLSIDGSPEGVADDCKQHHHHGAC